jgi:2-polyprenyl-3-methyl-5-hydroxy-6-metoxy-1,4-benzoquinol methylase
VHPAQDQAVAERRTSAFRQEVERLFTGNDAPEARVWLDYALSTNERGAQVAHKLLDFVPSLKGLRLLDVGSGYGGICVAAAKAGARAVGIEIDPRLLELANLNRSDWPQLDVQFHARSAMDWPALEELGQFDVITCDNVIEHVPVPQVLLTHIRRLLKPGGLLYLTVPNAYSFGQVLKDCHYGQFCISLLDPWDGQAYLKERLPWATYDVSHYFRLGEYETQLATRGLKARLINSIAPADEEVAQAVAARDELVRRRAEAQVPAAWKPKVDALVDAHLVCFEADVGLFRSLPPGLEREEFGHWLARTYTVEQWYFVATRARPAV